MDVCVLHHDVRSMVYIYYVYSLGHNFCMGSTVAMNYKTVSIATYSSENLRVNSSFKVEASIPKRLEESVCNHVVMWELPMRKHSSISKQTIYDRDCRLWNHGTLQCDLLFISIQTQNVPL